MAETETDADLTAPEEAIPPQPELLHGAPVITDPRGQTVAFVGREQYVAVMEGLKDQGFDFCSDLCGVDYLTHPGRWLPDGVEAERFEVVVNLLSTIHRRRVRIRVQVPDSDPRLPSMFGLWPGTEAMEREVWDMFGIAFDGHPDLTRILMPEDWEGHPLRKDYAVGRVPVQFKATSVRPDGGVS
jgi:NADH-quinone oxidoreductase subunit C